MAADDVPQSPEVTTLDGLMSLFVDDARHAEFGVDGVTDESEGCGALVAVEDAGVVGVVVAVVVGGTDVEGAVVVVDAVDVVDVVLPAVVVVWATVVVVWQPSGFVADPCSPVANVPAIEFWPTATQVMNPPPGIVLPGGLVEVNVESLAPEPTPSHVGCRLWADATLGATTRPMSPAHRPSKIRFMGGVPPARWHMPVETACHIS